MSLRLVHLELPEANAFILRNHRHLGRAQGHRFSIGVVASGALVGCAVVGRAVGGLNPDTMTEVTRCCTDGTKNACSFLYAAAARASAALGFYRIQTYVLDTESAASLKAAGWEFDRMSHPVGWHHDGPRTARTVAPGLMDRKQLWFKLVGDPPFIERGEREPDDQLVLIS